MTPDALPNERSADAECWRIHRGPDAFTYPRKFDTRGEAEELARKMVLPGELKIVPYDRHGKVLPDA